MRRPTFFISSRSHSADLLASELVLTIIDQFPKTEGVGVLGKWSSHSRVVPFMELDAVQAACIALGLEEGLRPLKERLSENLPQIAILVGYSAMHHALAGFFKEKEVPVILYEITPQQALRDVSLAEAKDRIKMALSIHRAGSSFLREAAIPFHYIGTPYRDRVAKVDVKASAFKFLNDKPLITLFPGGYGEALQQMLPLFSQLAQNILEENDCQVVVSLREELDFDKTVLEFKKHLPLNGRVTFVLGMHLELLSLSRLAITGSGAITIESVIAQIPFLPIYDPHDKADESGSYSLVNQSLGRKFVTEFSNESPLREILDAVKALASGGAEHAVFARKLLEAQSEFEGSAADNAADYIVLEAGLGKKRARPIPPPSAAPQ